VDERYSSSEAEEELRAMGRWPAPKGQVDAQSAVILLRRFLAGEQ
jgi:RNase H-fold protein (predicted Holliday junction resolvase)